jgi:hypothetical protein
MVRPAQSVPRIGDEVVQSARLIAFTTSFRPTTVSAWPGREVYRPCVSPCCGLYSVGQVICMHMPPQARHIVTAAVASARLVTARLVYRWY